MKKEEFGYEFDAEIARMFCRGLQPCKKQLFSGGVARNPCMRRLMEEALDTGLLVPENPQMVGALGAGILGKENR